MAALVCRTFSALLFGKTIRFVESAKNLDGANGSKSISEIV